MYVFIPLKLILFNYSYGFVLSEMDYLSVLTNNGVERKNKDFKHQYLAQFKDKSLSGMITVLIEQYLPDKEKRLVYSLYIFVKITHIIIPF